MPRNNGSDADDDDNDGEVDGGFIDLGEVREQEPYPSPPGYPPPAGYPSDSAGNTGFTHPRIPNIRHRAETAMVVHPNGTVIHAPTQHSQHMQLQLNGSSAVTRTTPSLPFPLTAHTSPIPTPEPNGANQPVQTSGASSSSATRRHSPGFLSFATAIARGTWMGGSARQADATDSSPPPPAVNGNTPAAGPSSTQQAPVISGPSALAAHNASSSSPVMRQWNPNPVTWGPVAGGSQLPSPSNSAAAFAMAGSTSQAVSPSNSRHPSSRDASVESLLTVRQRSSSRQDIRALEESLQDALGGTQAASRGRERQRAAPNGFTPSYGEPTAAAAASSSSRSNSSRQGSGNGTHYSPVDGWQSRSRT